jgi:hypothetical protein
VAVRLLLLAIVASLLAVAPAAAAERVVERGIVQSIDASAVVLRALDGTDVTVALGPGTRFRLNGRAATIDLIRPGLVAEAVTDGLGPARVLRAFGRPGRTIERGVIVRLGPRTLVVQRDGGGRIRVAWGLRTGVWRGARRIRPGALRPGQRIEAVIAADGSAVRVHILGSGG